MNGDIPDSSPLGSLLQSFFTEHMLSHRRASQQTVDSYRDTFRLLLRFLRDSTGKEPARLRVGDLDAPAILSFLNHVEQQRKNQIQCVTRPGERSYRDQSAGDSAEAR
jgi:site-specific recombinase XerD